MDSLNDYVSTELKILAICYDNNLEEKYGIILSYFYHRSKTINSINLFDEDQDGLKNIKISLGEIPIDLCDDMSEEDKEIYKATINFMNGMNNIIRDFTGKENSIHGDLKNRKRLYTDRNYFEEIKNYYLTLITPNLPFYNDDKVNAAFEKHFLEKSKKDDIDELLESISSGEIK